MRSKFTRLRSSPRFTVAAAEGKEDDVAGVALLLPLVVAAVVVVVARASALSIGTVESRRCGGGAAINYAEKRCDRWRNVHP